MPTRILVRLAVAATILGWSASADQSSTLEIVQGEVSKQDILAAAKYGEPLVVAWRKGTTLLEAVKAVCGPVSNEYLQNLLDRYEDLNEEAGPAEILTRSSVDRTMVVPFCFDLRTSIVKARIQRGENRKSLVHEGPQMIVAGPLPSEPDGSEQLVGDVGCRVDVDGIRCVPRRPEYLDIVSQLNGSEKIKRGSELLVPFTHDQSGSRRVGISFASLDRANAFESYLTTVNSSLRTTREPGVGELIGDLTVGQPNMRGEDCGLGRDESRPAVDWTVLRQALDANETARQINQAGEPHLRLPERRRSVVLVADTGYLGGQLSPFTGEIVTGVGFVGAADIFADKSGPHYQHGTQVASVALGGPTIAFMMSALRRADPIIQVGFYRLDRSAFQSNGDTKHVIDAAKLRLMSAGLQRNRQIVDVVNLSVKFESEPSSIHTDLIKGNSNVLFVVAAGNEGEHYDQRPLWPGMYGGPTGSNVITVAASVWTSPVRLAQFSSFSSDAVEIAAPGCKIEVLGMLPRGERYEVTAASGTSMSAPVVAFTAGLVRAEYSAIRARDLKARILDSADHSRDLDDQVAEGRVLNVAKAAAVFVDVIELADSTLRFGEVIVEEAGRGNDDSCNTTLSKQDRFLPRRIRREIVDEDGVPGGNIELYYRDSLQGDAVTKRRICSEDIMERLSFQPLGSDEPIPFGALLVHDVVFAERHFRRSLNGE